MSVGTDQIHDFNPRIAPSGLFWTVPLPPGGVSVTMTWTATSGGATYSSTGPSSSAFAIVGKERNGVFFG